MWCSVHIVFPSVLSCSNLKLRQTLEAKNLFKQENVMLQLTLNPGLTLTGFRTTRPRAKYIIIIIIIVIVTIILGYWYVASNTQRAPNTLKPCRLNMGAFIMKRTSHYSLTLMWYVICCISRLTFSSSRCSQKAWSGWFKYKRFWKHRNQGVYWRSSCS